MSRIKITEFRIADQNDGDGDEVLALVKPDAGAYAWQEVELFNRLNKAPTGTVVEINKEYDCNAQMILMTDEYDRPNADDKGEAVIDCTNSIPTTHASKIEIMSFDPDTGGEQAIYEIYYIALNCFNNLPTAEDFTVSVDVEKLIYFSSHIDDAEDADSSLKIKLQSLPATGTLTASGVGAELYAKYGISILKYIANPSECGGSYSDSFTYKAVDTNGLESTISTVNLDVIAPSCSEVYCMHLTKVKMLEIGDLDREQEEIAFEIGSWGQTILCELFKFEIGESKSFDLSIPCESGEDIDFLLIEKDNCNDDHKAKTFECIPTMEKKIEIEINPDATTREECHSNTFTSETCGGVELKKILGFNQCATYTLGKDECTWYGGIGNS